MVSSVMSRDGSDRDSAWSKDSLCGCLWRRGSYTGGDIDGPERAADDGGMAGRGTVGEDCSSHRRPFKQPRPVRSSRTQVQSYHEESSSEDRLDEDLNSDHEQSRRLSLSLRPRDLNRMPVSYREESTDDNFEGGASDEEPETSVPVETSNRTELHIDAEILLSYKSGPTLGYFELPKLIDRAPQLKTLRLYHSDDYIVGLPLWQRTKWAYPESLFTSLISSSIRLRSWDWNSRFMETNALLPFMMEKHLQASFSGLRELRLLHIASEDSDVDDPADVSNEREVVLATALKELPELRRLEFLECSIVNEHLLPNLSPTLTSLTINNCDEVTTANFSAFLASHGQHLRDLALSHNRHLSLSFIVGLAQSCRSLEKFKMDISIHDLSSYHDVEPHFRELLNSSEVPTWPSTLQDIELIQLRKWDDTTADVFFTSLLDAAPELRNLRRLVISAILKIGWRDRASFREKWISRLEKVFLRRSALPDATLSTIPRASQPPVPGISTASIVGDNTTQPDSLGSGFSTPLKRKSARLAQQKLSEVEDDAGLSVSRRATPDSGDNKKPLAIQGMCDVVMVRIDNQRPSETQFNEEDFLDDELSGDEDWNGNDMDAGGTTHAW
ncbi:hypothetical protein AARAC_001091 [Aspergillus arachidicola]|uniref:Uncharacterized protein n=1 Tax=Aspergillus arachidicola TaxID=656916 RepID=A0A2G7FU14_9EURO|nr:hypothetical protein AARAC_001091 [Aspergillus arachidicola]